MSWLGRYWRIPYLRRAALFALVALLAALGAGTRLYLPAAESYALHLEELQRLSQQRAELDARIALTDRVAGLSADIATLDARLGQGGERSAVVERFAELAAGEGVRIVHGTNRFGQPRSGIEPVFHELTVEGDYLSMRGFLAAANLLDTLTLLVSAELTGNPDGTLVRGQLEFVTYGEATP